MRRGHGATAIARAAAVITAVGCRSPAPRIAEPTSPAGDFIRTLSFRGRPRVYHLHVPTLPDPLRPAPLVLNFHGWGSSAIEQRELSRLIAAADRHGFLAVHPEGVGAAAGFNGGACCGDAVALGLDDVGLAVAILDDVGRVRPVDGGRVYAMGMSNGGFLAHRIGCERADRVAAIASVAGLLGIPECRAARPVSVLQIHGTADAIVPYAGGGLAAFGGVEATVRGWADRNRCAGARADGGRAVVFRRGDATCEYTAGCADGTAVILCRIEGGGHTWPGGPPVPRLGPTTSDLDATDFIWRFFAEHPRADGDARMQGR